MFHVVILLASAAQGEDDGVEIRKFDARPWSRAHDTVNPMNKYE